MGPLSGVRVLDLSWLGPGCVTTWLLADLGAEVIKVEPPDGSDNVRNFAPFVDGVAVGHLALDHGKRSLALNLRTEGGRDAFLAVARTADAVVEGFRPGVADRLGIGYQQLRAVRPSIVYCTVTGYGAGGPLSSVAGHDLNYVAQAGMLSLGNLPIEPPPLQAADYLGAALAAFGVAAGVVQARTTGEGIAVESSLFDGAMYSLVLPAAWALVLGQDLAPGEHFLVGGRACYGAYACADGEHLTVAALEPKFWTRFCELVGLPPEAVRDQHDPARQAELRSAVAEAIGSRPLAEWLEIFEGEDVCVAPVLTMAAAAGQPHLRARGMIAKVRHPNGEVYEVPAGPLRLADRPALEVGEVPEVGADTEALLREAGYGPAAIEELVAAGAASTGSRSGA